jgi:hypothetical protein
MFGVSSDALDVLAQLPKDSELHRLQMDHLMTMYVCLLVTGFACSSFSLGRVLFFCVFVVAIVILHELKSCPMLTVLVLVLAFVRVLDGGLVQVKSQV